MAYLTELAKRLAGIEQRERVVAGGHPSEIDDSFFTGLSGATVAGPRITQQNSLEYVPYFAGVRVLSEDVAVLPFKLYRPRGPKGREPVRMDRRFKILHDQPNPEMTAFSFREAMMGHLLTWGNCFAEIEFDRLERPINLWPLRPDRMTVERRNGQLFYYYQTASGEFRLPPMNVFHVMGLSPDGIVGYSPVQLARQAIALGVSAEQFGASFFGNGAMPGIVATHPHHLTNPARERIRKDWETLHQGAKQAHRLAILEEGISVNAIGVPPESSQFLETREFQVLDVCRILRLPPHKLAFLKDATFSNVEHMGIEYVSSGLGPWLVRWEQEADRKLLSEAERDAGLFFKHTVEALLRGDFKTRMEGYKIGREWGWYSPNDVNELEDRNPIPAEKGGDDYLRPMNMSVAGEVAEIEEDEEVDDEETIDEIGDESDEELEDDDESMRSNGRVSGRELARLEAKTKRNIDSRLRLRAAFERVLLVEANRLVRSEIAGIRKILSRLAVMSDAQAREWFREFYKKHQRFAEKVLGEIVQAYMRSIADEAASQIGVDPNDPALAEATDLAIADYLAAMTRRYSGSGEAQMTKILTDSSGDRDSWVELITERLEEWGEKRAEKIVMRETIQAGELAARTIFGAAGVGMIWIAIGEESCPLCLSLDGQRVGTTQPFLHKADTVGADDPDGPTYEAPHKIMHPPLHRGCDCMVVPEL